MVLNSCISLRFRLLSKTTPHVLPHKICAQE
jgi:hypothetical protein